MQPRHSKQCLGHPAVIEKIEVQLTHFSKGLTADDEGEDNHVVTIVLER